MGRDGGRVAAAADEAVVADMSAADGYRIVLGRLARTAIVHLPGAVVGADPIHLHQFRVAVRRSRAVLADVKPVLTARAVAEARDGFARLGRVTGPARDLDVLTAAWPSLVGDDADASDHLEPVLDLLHSTRDAAHRQLRVELGSAGTRRLFDDWASLLDDDWSSAVAKGGRRALGDVVARRVDAAHLRVLERGRLIDDRSPATDLHDLRKDVKAVRYLVECFDGLTEERVRRRYAKRLRRLQGVLGTHQDADVHLGRIEELAADVHAAGASAQTILALGRMSERLARRRTDARSRFVDEWATFDAVDTEDRLRAFLESVRPAA